MRKILLPVCILLYTCCMGQSVELVKAQADSLFDAGKKAEAAHLYVTEAGLQKFIPYRKQAFVNASYAFSDAGNIDSGIYALKQAVYRFEFKNKGFLLSDAVMLKMKNHPAFDSVIQYLDHNETAISSPAGAKILTGDIDLFWKAYDHYLADTVHAEEIFMQEYFEKGSAALQDYFRVKVRTIQSFTKNVKRMPLFLKSIRQNTLSIKTQEPAFRECFVKLENIYPPAVFSPLYFVIGMLHSGGTVNDYGSVAGADMQSKDEHTNISELSLWQRNNLQQISGIKYVVAHEMVHNQQGNLADDTSLLKAALLEGMADFIGELISGKNANNRLHVWAKGKEKKIWQEFTKEMYLNKAVNWIANGNQETADKPADLGYWTGYQICKAYYENAADKKQAVYDILNIKDYRTFYEKSGVEKWIAGL